MRSILALVIVAGAAAGACSESSAPVSTGQAPLGFRAAISPSQNVSASGALSALSAAPALTFTDDAGNSLSISSASVVLRSVRFSRADGGRACPDGMGEPAAGDSCESVAAGPLLVDLPLSGSAAPQFTVELSPGVYDDVRFEIHRASAASDAAFVGAHPGLEGVSIEVTGIYNSAAFTYRTDLNAEHREPFPAAVTVSSSASASVTLRVDLAHWFVTAGHQLVDPVTALHGGANEALVTANIQHGFSAFGDRDHNGQADD